MKMLALGLGLLVCGIGYSQFPDGWIGKWQGELQIYSAQGKAPTLQMELHIEELTDTSWSWAIIYGTDSSDIRPYELIKKGDSPHYVMDEKNSILIDMSYINNAFYTSFEVNGSQLTIWYEMVGETLMFRVLATGGEPTKSGDDPENEIPPVIARKTMASQIAYLKKVEVGSKK